MSLPNEPVDIAPFQNEKKIVKVPSGITLIILLPNQTTHEEIKEITKAMNDAVNAGKEILLLQGMSAIYNKKIWKLVEK